MRVFTVFLALECEGKLFHQLCISHMTLQLVPSLDVMAADTSNDSEKREKQINQTKVSGYQICLLNACRNQNCTAYYHSTRRPMKTKM